MATGRGGVDQSQVALQNYNSILNGPVTSDREQAMDETSQDIIPGTTLDDLQAAAAARNARVSTIAGFGGDLPAGATTPPTDTPYTDDYFAKMQDAAQVGSPLTNFLLPFSIIAAPALIAGAGAVAGAGAAGEFAGGASGAGIAGTEGGALATGAAGEGLGAADLAALDSAGFGALGAGGELGSTAGLSGAGAADAGAGVADAGASAAGDFTGGFGGVSGVNIPVGSDLSSALASQFPEGLPAGMDAALDTLTNYGLDESAISTLLAEGGPDALTQVAGEISAAGPGADSGDLFQGGGQGGTTTDTGATPSGAQEPTLSDGSYASDAQPQTLLEQLEQSFHTNPISSTANALKALLTVGPALSGTSGGGSTTSTGAAYTPPPANTSPLNRHETDMSGTDWAHYGEGPEKLFFDNVNPPLQYAHGGFANAGRRAQSGLSAARRAAAPLSAGMPAQRVSGPGTGQSDSIPAQLSDGEYIVDADTVAQLGDGSSNAGADALDGMVSQVRQHKRARKTGIPPKAKPPLQYLAEGATS